MPSPISFDYEAFDGSGQSSRGRISAGDSREALRLLHGKGLIPVTVSATPAARGSRSRKPPTAQDHILSLKQLSLLLNAGVPLVQAVATLKSQGIHPALSLAFQDIEKRIRTGATFSSAFTAALPALPPYASQLAASGEAIGRLGPALGDAVKQMEYDHQVAVEFRNALTYPAFLVTAGLAAVLFVFIVVVPRFSAMFAASKQSLPFISSVVLKTGMFLNDHVVAVGAVVVALIAACIAVSRDRGARVRIREALARAPLIGTWMKESDLATWASMLATMLANGIDLIKALQLARQSVRSPVLGSNLDQVAKLVRGGKALSAALAELDVFNQTAVSLVEVGEGSGELPAMLRSLATLYDEAGRQRMKRFLLLLEPAAIILIGGVIGGIVTAIMLAITSVNQLAL